MNLCVRALKYFVPGLLARDKCGIVRHDDHGIFRGPTERGAEKGSLGPLVTMVWVGLGLDSLRRLPVYDSGVFRGVG